VVVCHADHLLLQPEPGTRGRPQVIPFRSSTQSAVQPLVDAIWKRVEGWGIAGPGVYWKPELHVKTGRGAEVRFAELTALMQQSGVKLVQSGG
jgi:hypothetical protein